MLKRLIAWLRSLFKKPLPPVDYTLPKDLRTDLIYCYYGNMPAQQPPFESQLAETRDHITHHFIAESSGVPFLDQLREVKAAGKKAIVAVWSLSDDELTVFIQSAFFSRLDNIIDIIYLWDEPNLPNSKITQDELRRRIDFVRKIFPQAKLACIYADNPYYPCKELFDYVGIDNYEKRERILVDGTYNSLNLDYSRQKLILVVGGWEKHNQDPTAFNVYAHKHPEVGMFMPFVWFDNADQTTYKGIRSLPSSWAYRSIGRAISQQAE